MAIVQPDIFIHELGHIAFLKLFLPGSKVDIGFKIFFIYPSFYVDTSNTYFIPKYKRIAVYLAGNFMNCLYLIICSIFTADINKYNYDKTKMKGYLEDTVRGILMFIFLSILAYL